MIALPIYLLYIGAFLAAVLLSAFSIPNIIYVTKRKRLFDVPDHRKLHTRIVPNLGGVGIFFAFVIIATLFVDPAKFHEWHYIVPALLILFIVGVKDDLVAISASKKFIAQFAASLLVACFADVRLHSFYGLFGVGTLAPWFSIAFTVVGSMFITNAVNLIDGIDGLAGSIGTLACTLLGLGLVAEGNTNAAIVAFSLAGALVGFLRFNISPASIFMGDTGSLLVGFSLSTLTVIFVNGAGAGDFHRFIPLPAVSFIIALAILSIPIFDTFRVFSTRIMKGRSPFSPDRTHLHHYLLDIGFTHTQAVMILLVANVLMITLCITIQRYDLYLAAASLLVVSFGLFGVLFFVRRMRHKPATISLSDKLVTHNTSILKPEMTGEPELSISGNYNAPHLTVNGHRIHVDGTPSKEAAHLAEVNAL